MLNLLLTKGKGKVNCLLVGCYYKIKFENRYKLKLEFCFSFKLAHF